jgi:hypothetical protein
LKGILSNWGGEATINELKTKTKKAGCIVKSPLPSC